jgi:hypothetical protein
MQFPRNFSFVFLLLDDSSASEFYMHIKFIRRGITQKKAYKIQKKAKVWNQENLILLSCK